MKLRECGDRTLKDLNSITLASIEFKLVFSGFAKIATKIRSTLKDESLDILSFLRSYFKSDKLKFLIIYINVFRIIINSPVKYN